MSTTLHYTVVCVSTTLHGCVCLLHYTTLQSTVYTVCVYYTTLHYTIRVCVVCLPHYTTLHGFVLCVYHTTLHYTCLCCVSTTLHYTIRACVVCLPHYSTLHGCVCPSHFMGVFVSNSCVPNPIRTRRGGGLNPPYGFLLFTLQIFILPIPEIS